MDRVRELRAGRLLGLPVAALGLLAVTALASREPLSTPGQPARPAAGGLQINVSPWELALIAGGGLIAFIGLLIYGGWSRRTPMADNLRHLIRRLAVTILPLAAAVLIAGALSGLHRHPASQRHRLATHASRHRASAGSPSFIVPAWVTWGILGAVVAGTLMVVTAVRITAHRGEQPTLPSAVESAATAALVDLDTIADPRLAIIAAYRRMEQTLAEAGFARSPPEAPREYLGRVAGALEIDPKPLGTLTGLFEAAKFSLRELDASARQRAIAAVRALQSQLA
jgi:hypothetical protein